MYDLPYHKEGDEQEIADFIRDHPFAVLTGCDGQGMPVATQVPVLQARQGGRTLLRGHIMRNTDHHRAFEQNDNVLVVFAGRHAYVSGSWYSNPHTPSTWNYVSVHARGKIRFLSGEALEDMLRQTSLHFEGGDHASPTVYDNLPVSLKERVMPAIVAFEIDVTDIHHVVKLSQDRDALSYRKIIEKLSEQGEDGRAIAAQMEKRVAKLFPADSNCSSDQGA